MIKFFKKYKYTSLVIASLTIAMIGGVCGGVVVSAIHNNSGIAYIGGWSLDLKKITRQMQHAYE